MPHSSESAPGPRPDSPVARLADTQLAAYNAADLDAFCACFHPDVAVLTADGSVRMAGMLAFREAYATMFARFTNVAAHVDARVALGRHVVEREYWSRVDRGTDERLEGAVLVRYSEQDGLLRWVQFLPEAG
jgi:uncharacterized protein (TIGR02246 family)